MRVGSPEYQSKVRLFDALKEVHFPDWTAEMCQLNSELYMAETAHDDDACEATFAEMVDDAEDTMRYANSLGTVEL